MELTVLKETHTKLYNRTPETITVTGTCRNKETTFSVNILSCHQNPFSLVRICNIRDNYSSYCTCLSTVTGVSVSGASLTTHSYTSPQPRRVILSCYSGHTLTSKIHPLNLLLDPSQDRPTNCDFLRMEPTWPRTVTMHYPCPVTEVFLENKQLQIITQSTANPTW